MGSPTILVEGKSAEVYLRATMGRYSPPLAALQERIENPGGVSQLDARLGELKSQGQGDSVFVLWDQDVLARPGGIELAHVIDHPISYPFLRDFEELFPDWMVADALAVYNPDAGYPDETEIGDSCQVGGSEQSFYERLRACVRAHACEAERDPTAIDFPSKVDLAECLAKVANRTWYQPEEMRRVLNRLRALIGDSGESQSLIHDGVDAAEFALNSRVIESSKLGGKLALSVLPDLWLIDLDASSADKVVANCVAGPPCWSHDGSRIVFPSVPSQWVRNSEAIRIYDLESVLGPELRMIGNYLCWGNDGRIYGNSLQSTGYQVHAIDPTDARRRRVLPLPPGSIVACVDRKRARILIGEQGRRGKTSRRVCSIFRINDAERVWDGADIDVALSEYSAGAFSPDGRKITWPAEKIGGPQGTGLWMTDVDGATAGNSVRLTPPGGSVRPSCWSPDGGQVAFMWSRWYGDPIRVWVVDLGSRQLEPLVEGPFGVGNDTGLGALGCHSWAPSC